MRHLDSPAFGETSVRLAQWRTALFAVATIALGFVFTASALAADGFDRQMLLMAADESIRADIERADRHLLIVRHARKAEETCNALDCPLGESGRAMVARLDALLGEPDFDAVYSSGACRTYETAMPAGEVIQHAAAASVPALCGGGIAERTRDDAIAEARASNARWSFVAEHSNTSCNWVAAIAGEEALAGTLCETGRLTSADYGDIFWLYRIAGEWRIDVLEGVFDVAE